MVSADTLIVPSRTGFAPTTAPWARQRLTTLLHPEARPRHRCVLISRNRAARRRLLNEDEVLDALAPHGFERIDFDTLPLANQLRTIHESQVIVAVHGAALGHLLHAPSAGHLVEIAHPSALHPDYWGLTALAGWSHTILAATPTPGRADERDDINYDLIVDPVAVRAALPAQA